MNLDIYRESTSVKAFLTASIGTALICGAYILWNYINLRSHQPRAHPPGERITGFPPEIALLGGIYWAPFVFIALFVTAACVFGAMDTIRRRKRDAANKV